MTFAALNPSASVLARRARRLARAKRPGSVRRGLVWRHARCSTTSIRSAPKNTRWSSSPTFPRARSTIRAWRKLAKGAPSRRGEKIHRPRQEISRFGLGAKRPADDDLRAVSGGRLRQRRAVRGALREALSQVDRGRLRALSRSELRITIKYRMFRATRSARPRLWPSVPKGREGLSEFGICRATPSSRSR